MDQSIKPRPPAAFVPPAPAGFVPEALKYNPTTNAAGAIAAARRGATEGFAPFAQGVESNNRSLLVICKAAQEDLAAVEHAHGADSPEYRSQLSFVHLWIGRSFPKILDIAIKDLQSRGHGECIQTTGTA